LRSEKGKAKWTGKPPKGVLLEGDIWNVFKQTLDFLATKPLPNLPPLTGGLVGYFAYDIVRMFERIPDQNPNETSVPDLLMLLATDFAVLDHVDGTVWLIANAVNYDGTDERVDLAYEDALKRLDSMQASLSNPQSQGNSTFNMEAKLDYSNRTKSSDYQDSVKRAINYIEAGDAFQIVLSQRFDMKTQASGLDIYRVLRATNPSPYMYYLNVPTEDLANTEFEIIGSSPEALVTVKNRQAMMHPIAGTRARSSDSKIDDESAIELLNDPKEKAEHLMLVDLGRNDLGRVCGTLSGAPKVRAMEIIDELEPVRRGIYGGALGYFDFAGNMDVAITIRTALLKNGVAYVQAGAGVVADSLPSSEDMECQNKAAVVLRAVAIASSLG